MNGRWLVGIALLGARAMAQTPPAAERVDLLRVPEVGAVLAAPSREPPLAPSAPPSATAAQSTPLEGAIDPDHYPVGPGDRLLVELWGIRDLSMEVEVNAEGRLMVPRAGVFDARGLTLAQLREAVEKRLHEVYPSLRGGLTLVRPRTFLVNVTGAIARPGTYPATPATRVSALVQQAGGPLPRASTRTVQVRRVGSEQQVVADLVRFALLGDRGGDPTLLDGDTIFVPLREVEVEVAGAVRRPGSYELVEGRDVAELLALAGGVTSDGAAGLPLRVTTRASGDRLAVRSVPADTGRLLALHDGDRVYVPSLGDLRRTVIVEGAVIGAGTDPSVGLQRLPNLVDHHADAPVSLPRDVSVPVAFVDGDGVRDLITKVGGLQPWADPSSAYLIRTIDGNRKRIALDVTEITAGRAPEVEVRAGDTLVVPSREDSVTVGGAVARPGLYTYRRGLAPTDFLALAGGATRVANAGGARVLHRDGRSQQLSKATSIEPGDTITVPERRITTPEWVEIGLLAGNIAVSAAALSITALRY